MLRFWYFDKKFILNPIFPLDKSGLGCVYFPQSILILLKPYSKKPKYNILYKKKHPK